MSASLRTLYVSDDFALFDWTCAGDDRDIVPETKTQLEVVFVRRGVFVAECEGQELPLTPNEVWLHPPALPYRVRHPRGGDECTVLQISEGLLAEYADSSRTARHTKASPRAFCLQHALWSAARTVETSPLEIEEITDELMLEVFSQPPYRRSTESHERVVKRTQELLATRFGDNLSLADIAREVDSSRYHLSRIFRAVTGRTIHGYRTELRLRGSLARLAAGESDLTALALDLGYCDHSHFTNAFRRAFGVPPSRFRVLGPRRQLATGA